MKASDIGYTLAANDIQKSTNVTFKKADLPENLKGKSLVIEYDGKKYDLNVNEFDENLIFATLPAVLTKAEVDVLVVSAK